MHRRCCKDKIGASVHPTKVGVCHVKRLFLPSLSGFPLEVIKVMKYTKLMNKDRPTVFLSSSVHSLDVLDDIKRAWGRTGLYGPAFYELIHTPSQALLNEYRLAKVMLSMEASGEREDIAVISEANREPERVELVTLRREVDGLKQQVAYLTGLMTLGTEDVQDPLASAKSRGTAYKKNELASPDNLNLVNASKYAGRADRVINMDRQRGRLYALVPEGNTRGYRYPKWQFDVPAARLRAVLEVLAPGSLSCWSLHSFLTRPHSDLDGKTPAAALADNTFDINRVIDVAMRRVDPHQGAC